MTNTPDRIKIYTRSMNGVLYRKAMALCRLPYPKVRLLHTTADGYLRQLLADSSTDWVINIDEDAFVCDMQALEKLIAYCIDNGYDNCGMPDGGVVHLRDGNPLVTNPYFNIMHTATLRRHIDHMQPAEPPDPSRFDKPELLVGAYDFHATNVEPYYPLFILMANRCRTLWLTATNHHDGESTVLCNHLGEPFLIHTWYSRFYNRDQFHSRRIDRAFKEACNGQGVAYRSPLLDAVVCSTLRAKSLFVQSLVKVKRKIVNR